MYIRMYLHVSSNYTKATAVRGCQFQSGYKNVTHTWQWQSNSNTANTETITTTTIVTTKATTTEKY